jgi:hypothetical protein
LAINIQHAECRHSRQRGWRAVRAGAPLLKVNAKWSRLPASPQAGEILAADVGAYGTV